MYFVSGVVVAVPHVLAMVFVCVCMCLCMCVCVMAKAQSYLASCVKANF